MSWSLRGVEGSTAGIQGKPVFIATLIIIFQALTAANQYRRIVFWPFQLFLSPFACRAPLCASLALLVFVLFLP